MSDNVYDISYLLESESAQAEVPVMRTAKAPPVQRGPSVAEAQEALARELLQAAETHEAMIRQYLRMYGPPDEPGAR